MKNVKRFYILIIILLAFSCNKNKSAQVPSNKVIIKDSTQLIIQEYNKKLVLEEDSILTKFTEKQPQVFQKHEIGIWYHFINENKNGTPLITKKSTKIDYKIFSLDRELLESKTEIEVVFGKKFVPIGLEEGIKMMKSNEKAEFIIPWYLAYGASGSEIIQPYTSLLFEVNTY